MKKILINHLKVYALLIPALVISSCSSDDDNTTIDDRDKFTGSWTCKETPTGQAPTTFSVSISKYGNHDTVYAANFNNLGSSYKAVFLISGNSVVIPNQDIGSNPVYTASGSGTYSNNKISLNYAVDADNFTAECSK